jgi:hypothetical protein
MRRGQGAALLAATEGAEKMNRNNYLEEVVLSGHAADRLRQRGIKKELFHAFLSLADCERNVGGLCVARTCSEMALAEAARDGLSADEVAQLRRLVAILGEDGTVVTIMNSETWFGRFQRGHARLSARERAIMNHRRERGGLLRA